jgi:prefoldin beta subunit
MVTQQNQQLLAQGGMYQQQLQVVIAQKDSLGAQLLEIDKALQELGKTKEKTVYKISGPVLVKTATKEAKDELEEKKKFIELKIKTLEKSEKTLKEKLEGISKQLSSKDVTVG